MRPWHFLGSNLIMNIDFFFKGLLLGFAIAAPVGPIGLLCIRKTLEFGRLSGLFSGLGAALADAVYAIIAAFGLTFISNLMISGQYWFRLIGGAFLIYLGWKTFSAQPSSKPTHVDHTTLIKDFLSTFLLTLTNPLTILSFVGAFAGLGFSYVEGGYYEASKLVLGVFLGSACWWLTLCEGVTFFRKKMSSETMKWINRIAGLFILSFGIIAIVSIFFTIFP